MRWGRCAHASLPSSTRLYDCSTAFCGLKTNSKIKPLCSPRASSPRDDDAGSGWPEDMDDPLALQEALDIFRQANEISRLQVLVHGCMLLSSLLTPDPHR